MSFLRALNFVKLAVVFSRWNGLIALVASGTVLFGFLITTAASGGTGSSSSSSGGGGGGGANVKVCSTTKLLVFTPLPKISFRYDGRQFNVSFNTLRKSSARDNNIYLSCYAPYPVTFEGGDGMPEKISKLFEENLETYCVTELKAEPILTNPECKYYEVQTSLPVHHLDKNVISARCESYCAQVGHATKIRVEEKRKVIYGNMSSFKLKGRGNVTFVPSTPPPPLIKKGGGKVNGSVGTGIGSKGISILGFRGPGVDHDLVQIYVSPVGAQGKYWNIKCTTYSHLTARGAWLILKLRNSDELFLANYTKEYRKAGIHTIRTTFDRPSDDIDYLLCLFPRLDDFTWISRYTSIHFEAPMTYWECVLHFCGAFVGLFIVVAGVCLAVHRFIHSDCLNLHHHKEDGMSSMRTSACSSQLTLHRTGVATPFTLQHHQRNRQFQRRQQQWSSSHDDNSEERYDDDRGQPATSTSDIITLHATSQQSTPSPSSSYPVTEQRPREPPNVAGEEASASVGPF